MIDHDKEWQDMRKKRAAAHAKMTAASVEAQRLARERYSERCKDDRRHNTQLAVAAMARGISLAAAARTAGMSRTALYRALREFGIDRRAVTQIDPLLL